MKQGIRSDWGKSKGIFLPETTHTFGISLGLRSHEYNFSSSVSKALCKILCKCVSHFIVTPVYFSFLQIIHYDNKRGMSFSGTHSKLQDGLNNDHQILFLFSSIKPGAFPFSYIEKAF